VHGRRNAEYVNSKGNHIHIWCNPIGYPGEHSHQMETLDYTGKKLKRRVVNVNHEFFIVEI
jgi:formylmethanofuran dehydrogenase subunit A